MAQQSTIEPLLSSKEKGAYYTPDAVAATLTAWVVRDDDDRLLDPSCGDGRFIAAHKNSVGVEQDASAASQAMLRAPWALVHEGDFFAWAENTHERFDCLAGNPPFIRYQTFKGAVRDRALRFCAELGANFSGLTSSWAPFLVAATSLLKRGGRMAFIVPAEIGHAPYAAPLLEYLIAKFGAVQIVAIRAKLFPELSEDCWLLYAGNFGESATEIKFTLRERFHASKAPPSDFVRVSISDWRSVWKRRLRPYLISEQGRDAYRMASSHLRSYRLGDIATVALGYVSGANDFFHLRPSQAEQWDIPKQFLHASVRNGRALPERQLTSKIVSEWMSADESILLLRIPKTSKLPSSVRKYLDSELSRNAKEAYKCRSRDPWYSVPDVQVPDFFLTYMCGVEAQLVRNEAKCTCTNSVHVVRVKQHFAMTKIHELWETPLARLSCEIEGHPLGGGMLKLELREAAQIVLLSPKFLPGLEMRPIKDALHTMQAWRHYAAT